MARLLFVILCTLPFLFQLGCTSHPFPTSDTRKGVVVLDIGHHLKGDGARTPGAISGATISECTFWYRYAYYVKRTIERAGYPCVVTNRGYAPESEPMLSYARRARVIHMKRPGQGGKRYPSYYHPDRVGGGVISADYAIYRQASCVVFLHHNSSSSRWKDSAADSLIICNRYNGTPLARCLAQRLNREIINHGMTNDGRECRIQPRYVDADRSAAWMNACDDSGIPAAVIEAAYLNHKNHAAFLANDANARRYAECIGRGVVDYLKSHRGKPHRRANENQMDEGSFGYAAESRRLTVPGAKLLVPANHR